MLLRLEEGRLCPSGCRPGMRLHPFMRTLDVRLCPILCEGINTGPGMLGSRNSGWTSTSCVAAKLAQFLNTSQMTKIIGNYLCPVVRGTTYISWLNSEQVILIENKMLQACTSTPI